MFIHKKHKRAVAVHVGSRLLVAAFRLTVRNAYRAHTQVENGDCSLSLREARYRRRSRPGRSRPGCLQVAREISITNV